MDCIVCLKPLDLNECVYVICCASTDHKFHFDCMDTMIMANGPEIFCCTCMARDDVVLDAEGREYYFDELKWRLQLKQQQQPCRRYNLRRTPKRVERLNYSQ